MNTRKSNHANMVVGHLNAPYGAVLDVSMLERAFILGTFKVPGATVLQRGLLASIFVECSPMLIYLAAQDLGHSLAAAQKLYRSVVESGEPRCQGWEAFVAEQGVLS